MKKRKVTKKEIEKMNKLSSKLIQKRGEIIHWLTETESTLDEIIIEHFIKKDRVNKFFNMFLWEDFKLSTKIRMFGEVDLPESIKEIQKYTKKELEKISSIRNKYAHKLSLITLEKAYLIDKNHNPLETDDKSFSETIEHIKSMLGNLKMILFNQKGYDISSLSKGDLIWMKLKDIKT